MPMLTQTGRGYKPAPDLSGPRDIAGTRTIADFTVLKRFWLRALGPLLTTGAIAGIIGVKAAIFLSRINY